MMLQSILELFYNPSSAFKRLQKEGNAAESAVWLAMAGTAYSLLKFGLCALLFNPSGSSNGISTPAKAIFDALGWSFIAIACAAAFAVAMKILAGNSKRAVMLKSAFSAQAAIVVAVTFIFGVIEFFVQSQSNKYATISPAFIVLCLGIPALVWFYLLEYASFRAGGIGKGSAMLMALVQFVVGCCIVAALFNFAEVGGGLLTQGESCFSLFFS